MNPRDIRTGSRVRCPRCGSNNFVGTAVCWQCSASLPPPEEFPPALTAANSGGLSPRPPAHTIGPRTVAVVASICLLACLVGAWAVLHSRAPGVPAGADSRQAQLNALKDRMLRSDQLPSAHTGPAIGEDPLETRARRELERLRREAGMSSGGSGSSDEVHLRMGGSIPREQWERTQRALSGSR